MSIPSELGHLSVPINFRLKGKNQMAQASSEPGTSRPGVLRSAAAPQWMEILRDSLYPRCTVLHYFAVMFALNVHWRRVSR